MISWQNLIFCIEKLEELPNGNGAEIEFCYQGAEYGVVSNRGSCDIGKCADMIFDGKSVTYSEERIYTYRTLAELGKARDIGFSVKECWESFENVRIRPDFDEYPFEEIYAAYEKASKH